MSKLRGSKREGYRTMQGICCPSCAHEFHLRGAFGEDRQGPFIEVYPVQRAAGEYTDADLARIYDPTPVPAAISGLSLPQGPGNVKLKDDPVPSFNRSDV